MTATCTITGCVGYLTADGRRAHRMVEAGQAFDDGDPIVVSRPDCFDVVAPAPVPAPVPAKRGPGRPPKLRGGADE